MKVINFSLIILILFNSCGNPKVVHKEITVYDTVTASRNIMNHTETEAIDLDSVKKVILHSKTRSDTVRYRFSLEDVGTEGNEGLAYYKNGKLQRVDLNIFTSMWKISMHYVFNDKNIRVTEATFNIYEKVELIKEIPT